jgi:hypothetical protein
MNNFLSLGEFIYQFDAAAKVLYQYRYVSPMAPLVKEDISLPAGLALTLIPNFDMITHHARTYVLFCSQIKVMVMDIANKEIVFTNQSVVNELERTQKKKIAHCKFSSDASIYVYTTNDNMSYFEFRRSSWNSVPFSSVQKSINYFLPVTPGNLLISSAGDSSMKIISSTGAFVTEILSANANKPMNHMIFSANKQKMASSNADNQISIWNINSSEVSALQQWQIEDHFVTASAIQSSVFTKDAKCFVCTTVDSSVIARIGKREYFAQFPDSIIAFHPLDNNQIVFINARLQTYLFDPHTSSALSPPTLISTVLPTPIIFEEKKTWSQAAAGVSGREIELAATHDRISTFEEIEIRYIQSELAKIEQHLDDREHVTSNRAMIMYNFKRNLPMNTTNKKSFKTALDRCIRDIHSSKTAWPFGGPTATTQHLLALYCHLFHEQIIL